MLRPSINYQEELQEAFTRTWFDDRYKFFHNAAHYEQIEVPTDTYSSHQFVSVNDDDEVCGCIAYYVDREANSATSLGIINFEDKPSLRFAADLLDALRDIFEKYRFGRLEFSVLIGNPAEESYDRLCEMFGGRIIGTRKRSTRLADGKLYDEKMYEVLAEDYFRATGRGYAA